MDRRKKFVISRFPQRPKSEVERMMDGLSYGLVRWMDVLIGLAYWKDE